MAARPPVRAVLAVAGGLALVAVLIIGGRAVYDQVDQSSAASCTTGTYTLDAQQAVVASEMVGVVLRRSLPERASVLVLAAALQESKLTDVPAGQGDRDSVGVLQQRPSQGWGTPAQLADVQYATGAFLDRLVKLDAWQTRPLTQVVQDVQRSAYPDAYAQHEPEAQALSDAFHGRAPHALTCSYPLPTQPSTSAQLAASVVHDLPVNAPVTTGATVSVPGAGWATAAWFVANGQRLGLDSVSYGGQTWTRAHGWRADTQAGSGAVDATLHT